MHYLPPMLRAQLMDALYSLTTDNNYNEKTRLAMSYKLLASSSKFKLFAPCVKHYLSSHVKSRFIKIEASGGTLHYSYQYKVSRKLGQPKFGQTQEEL